MSKLQINAIAVRNLKTQDEVLGIEVIDGYSRFFIKRDDVYSLQNFKQLEVIVLHENNELEDAINYIRDEHEGIVINGTWYDYDEFKYVFHKNLLDVAEVVLNLHLRDGVMDEIAEETGENISAVEMADFIADWDFTMYDTYEIMQMMGLTNHMVKLESENQKTFTADEIVKNYNVWYDEIY